MTRDLYTEVTQTILDALDAGTVPWQKPWTDLGLPKSLGSGKPYQGVNAFLLALQGSAKGYSSPYWTTFNEAKKRGGSVRKGEKGTIVVFWKRIVKEEDDGEKKVIPILKNFTVFNIDQCDGIEQLPADAYTKAVTHTADERHHNAGLVLKGYLSNNGPRFREDSHDGCYYVPSTDSINVPHRSSFVGLDEFYASVFHEAGHSTGHADRLDRFGAGNAKFGSHEYGREELVAEMTAAFVSAETGIVATVSNSANYIDHWRQVIKEDVRAVVVAAGKAQKAANWILGRESNTEEEK